MSIAIVTGANSGIGRGTALALARRGFDLGITWHSDEENLDAAVAELEAEGVRVETRQVDLSQVPGPDAVIDDLTDALGGLDAYVANAAAGHSTPFLELGSTSGSGMTGNEDTDRAPSSGTASNQL